MRLLRSGLSVHTRLARRAYASSSTSRNEHTALDQWITGSPTRQLVLDDRLSPEHTSDLFITLPTRDGTRRPYTKPKSGDPLPYGHHLAFFHPRTPEKYLRPDGTDADFCPPEPFVRRMWAGGKIKWNGSDDLRIGEYATSKSIIKEVEKKGFETGSPMVFVKQHIQISSGRSAEPQVEEERSHVYLGLGVIMGLPPSQFSLTYTPSPTTLFRFSALTFNGHQIHLDRDYAHSEGYSERLVHGPLTALMLLETLVFHNPNAVFSSFEYRAMNPVVVNRPITIHGALEDDGESAQLWTEDGEGVVGMKGVVKLRNKITKG
ncbi:uncharacterized protein STEHIDRAFT_108664 [Stereum hirsutum FP-91666 SS1]|uniref:uncharacterized protein n=1 Tax=Stereum hirsutum (strain FP-91666) TaxID=721885 RepID=UPI000440D1C4|nr:uncharacterized protein STEHIDRAFT_108664 [Stereum hirsutum FP-91666 SS1]EIM90072.1 hypothetical protein STEHIDRAFT_108664 [Stereum hirsutum FP-91666 SS1]